MFPPTTGDSQLQRLYLRQAAHVLAQRPAQLVARHVPPPHPPKRPVELDRDGAVQAVPLQMDPGNGAVRVRAQGAGEGGTRAARDVELGALMRGVQELRRPPPQGLTPALLSSSPSLWSSNHMRSEG